MGSRRVKAGLVFSLYLALFLLGAIASSCNGCGKGGDSSDNPPADNHTVTAIVYANVYSGSRQTLFILDGSQSLDSSGQALNYQWSQLFGPSVSLSPASASATVSFYPASDYVGDYVFWLTVSSGSVSDSNSVRITVANTGPVAQVAQEIFRYPKQEIVLDGSASQDPDGDPLQFSWSQLSGATVALDLSVPSRPSFTASAYGKYVFQLSVSDGLLSSSAQTAVYVIAPEFQLAPAKGQNRVLVLLANFSDTSPSFNAQDFQNLLFADTALTMRDYYRTVSYGQFELVGDVIGWVNLSHPKSYYNNDNKGTEPKDYPHNLWSLVEEAVDLAEAQGVDFSKYDNDGDGWVDSLVIIHQGMDYQRSGDMNNLATIQSVLSLGRAQTRYYDGKKIEYFTLCPEQRKPDPVTGAPRIMDISTYTREYAYLLGMKRSSSLYVHGLANPPSNPTGYEVGVGLYDLMAYGVYGGDGTRFWQPDHPAAFHKSLVGWLAPEVITADTTLTLPAVETHPYAAKVMTGPDPREYFLLTNQQRLNYDEKLLSKGLYIWHIDQETFFQNTDQAHSSDPALCGYPDNPWSWRHPMLMLEQADGNFQLEDGTNLGDTVDSFRPGQEFSSASIPSSLRYDCYPSGIKISQVSESDTVVTVRVQLNQFQSDFSSPRLLLTDYYFSPASPGDGDTDPYAEPGETLELWLKLFNTGTAASNLSLQFATTSQYLVPILTNATYPDLAPGDSAYNQEPLRLQVKPTNTSELPAVLKLNLTANSGLFHMSKVLSINLGVPSILLVDDDGGAKADQRIMYELYSLGYQWAYWEVAQKGVPPLEEMLKHRLCLWITGPVVDEPLDSEELSRIEAYLDQGGKLVLSSQYLLVNPSQEAADFAHNYLHLDSWSDDNYAAQYIWGTTASPISSAMSWSKLMFINYYTVYPRTVGLTPEADAIPVLKNDRMNTTAVQFAEPGGYGIFYSAVGLEHLNYENIDLTARLMNGVAYLPGQPVLTNISPSTIAPRTYALALTVEGVNLTDSTSFAFPDGGINLLSKTYNPANQTYTLSVQLMYNAHPGYQLVQAQNPGLPPAYYDRLLRVAGSANANHPPIAIANASPASGTSKTTFTLDASQSYDPDHEPLTFQWTQIQGPATSLLPSATASAVEFQPPDCYTGDFLFKVSVYDGTTISGDTVRVDVHNYAPVPVVPPVIIGNLNQAVTMDARGSYDPDLDSFSFSWAQLSGPLVSFDHEILNPSFVPVICGSYFFTLTLFDGCLQSAATVELMVNDPDNHLPVPVVAWSFTVADSRDSNPVCLDGTPTGDYDPVDGDTIYFRWQMLSKPALSAAALDFPQSEAPCFFDDQPGWYTVSLQVTDYTYIWSLPVQVLIYSKTYDLDQDLIPDDYEIRHGMDPADPSDANADPDNDGLVSLHEYFNGTDPQFAEPWLVMLKGLANPWDGGFFGDSDADLAYGATDVSALVSLILTGNPSGYGNVYPPTGETSDFNGDGLITAADLAILNQLIAGDSADFTGAPDSMALIEPAKGSTTVPVGTTVRIMVQVTDAFSTPRSGSAVMFEVLEGATIAQLLGGDGQGIAKRLYAPVSEINRVNTQEFSPCLSPDGLEIFFSAWDGNTTLDDIYYASRSALSEPFSAPTLVAALSANTCDDYPGSMTGDNLVLYFYRLCKTGANYDPAKGGLYYATRSDRGSPFSAPVPLTELNGATYWEIQPWVSQDGLTVYYTSNREGGRGVKDIWRASRSLPTDLFGAPQNVTELNSAGGDGYASLSADQLHIVFISTRAGSGWNLYEASRAALGDAFSAPAAMSYVNRSGDEASPFLSPDGLTMYFSYPEVAAWDYDIFVASRPRVDMPFFINQTPGRFDLTGKMSISGELNSQGRAFIYVRPTATGTIKLVVSAPGDQKRMLPPAGLSQLITINAAP